jgi:hypothetical protein
MLPAPQVDFMHAPVAAHETVAKRHRPSGLTVFLSAFVAGAVVSFGINHLVDTQLAANRPQVECEPIFVALRSLPQGAPVTVWDVALKDWPLAMLPTSALRADNSFEGMVLRYPLREGQPLLAVQLAKAPTEPGAVATHVESFSSPTPAAARRTAAAESDAWLPAPQTTSTVAPRATSLAVSPVEPPRPVAVEPQVGAAAAATPPVTTSTASVEEPAPAGTTFDTSTDVADAAAQVTAAADLTDLTDLTDSTDSTESTAGADLAAGADGFDAAVGSEPSPSLPLVAIADTPAETTLGDSGPMAWDTPAEEAEPAVGMNMLLASAAPSSGILSVVEEPLSGFTATDDGVTQTAVERLGSEPRPFVAARRSRPPMAPHPRLDIADPIAVLTRERSPSPSARPLEAAADAPAESVLVPMLEATAAGSGGGDDVEPVPTAAGLAAAGGPYLEDPRSAESLSAESLPAESLPAESLSTESLSAESLSAESLSPETVRADAVPGAMLSARPLPEGDRFSDLESEDTLPGGTAFQDSPTDGLVPEGVVGDVVGDPAAAPPQTAATVPGFEEPAAVLQIPRYLVIPERIALEADSFFGPPTPAAEFPGESLARPATGDQAGGATPRTRAQYEAPPMANPPAPSFGEMFPNIANGIDALTGPFRGRSAAQPRRTR